MWLGATEGLIGLQKAREAGVALPAWVGALLSGLLGVGATQREKR